MKRSPLLVIFLTVFLDLLGFGIILPLLPFYAEHFGASASFIGLFGAAFSAMQFIFSPLLGRLSDRIGRRPVILLGVAGTIVSMSIFAFAQNKWMLLAGRAFAGIAGGNIAAAQAYITDVTTKENRAKGIGLIGTAFGLGFMFGPAIGGMMSVYGERAPGLFAAGLSAINLVLGFFLLPESLSPELRAQAASKAHDGMGRIERVWKLGFRHQDVGVLMVLFFLVTFAFTNLEATFALFTKARLDFDARHVGYMFGIVGIISVLIQGVLMGGLTRRFGGAVLLMVGVVSLLVGMVLMTQVYGVPFLIVALVFVSAGNALYNPSSTALISKLAPDDERGALLGVQASLGAMGRMVGPPLAGVLFDHFGPAAPYCTASVLLSIGLAVAILTKLHRK